VHTSQVEGARTARVDESLGGTSGASSVTATYSAYVPVDPSGGISNWTKTSSPGTNFAAPDTQT
jgi:hypothetical protein